MCIYQDGGIVVTTRFSRKNPPSQFYIYLYLRDDGTPYYVGKGKGARAWNKHVTKKIENFTPDNNNIVVIEWNLSEISAFMLERKLIRWFGRITDKDGLRMLINVNKGGQGFSGRNLGHTQNRGRKFDKKPCQYCGKMIADNGSIEKHERSCKKNPNRLDGINTKTTLKKYMCCHCGKSIGGKSNLKQHEDQCDNNPDKVKHKNVGLIFEKVPCQFCSNLFGTNSIPKHETTCQLNPNKTKIKMTINKIPCKDCGILFMPQNLPRHICSAKV